MRPLTVMNTRPCFLTGERTIFRENLPGNLYEAAGHGKRAWITLRRRSNRCRIGHLLPVDVDTWSDELLMRRWNEYRSYTLFCTHCFCVRICRKCNKGIIMIFIYVSNVIRTCIYLIRIWFCANNRKRRECDLKMWKKIC